MMTHDDAMLLVEAVRAGVNILGLIFVILGCILGAILAK